MQRVGWQSLRRAAQGQKAAVGRTGRGEAPLVHLLLGDGDARHGEVLAAAEAAAPLHDGELSARRHGDEPFGNCCHTWLERAAEMLEVTLSVLRCCAWCEDEG